ncbi:MAG TPA: ATP-binding protein [Deltaproteobacteria bacterium]|nr:ATP-binding protein [Deltaproteobacteria bacterium]HOI07050.1 ATP-binding protein [Deltaproteobacteria bacterium]
MDHKVPIEKLTCRCNADIFGCEVSSEGKPLQGIVGQTKALKALQFGLDIKEKGFNIYVSGVPGTGKKTAVSNYLQEIARDKPTPPDWCYVNNFQESYRPKAISLPAGSARTFKKQVDDFIDAARREVSKAFESEDYAAKKSAAVSMVQQEREDLINQINEEAQKEGFLIQATPMGLLTIPLKDNRPYTEEEFRVLDKDVQNEISEKQKKLNEDLKKTGRQMVSIEKKTTEQIDKLDREIASFTLNLLLEELKETFQDSPGVLTYLDEMRDDMLDNLSIFRAEEGKGLLPAELQMQLPAPAAFKDDMKFRKYRVNVVVDNRDLNGAPIIMELNPSYYNLFGRIEKEAMLGALFTDFTMIRSGSVHRANGGYLILPVYEVLRNMLSWESLKRSISNQDIRVEEAEERLGFMTTRWLVPEPIPWDVKVVLIGHPILYYRLYELDPDFRDLFKVKADFDRVMDRTEENMKNFSSFVCSVCNEEHLKHFEKNAIARVVEYSSRLAGDQNKLSTEFGTIADVVREASFYATRQDSPLVTQEHVTQAIEEKFNRSNMMLEKIREFINRGFIMIDVTGEAVGQVNGLSVMEMGDVMFGRPNRITASIGVGSQGLIDIEREAKLSGPIHTKGVLILSGYLTNRYAQDKPLSLAARLVFEQSYSGIEGDSASSAELYAIISALSGVPIRQGIAVTGSVNQRGEIQAIGGVNEKIEGYFSVCKLKGLTGEQGVMIPASNVQNLVLKDEVVQAVKEGRFHVWSVNTIDEGIEVLTGRKAGQKDGNGVFEEGSVNSLVDSQLRSYSEMWMNFSGGNGDR